MHWMNLACFKWKGSQIRNFRFQNNFLCQCLCFVNVKSCCRLQFSCCSNTFAAQFCWWTDWYCSCVVFTFYTQFSFFQLYLHILRVVHKSAKIMLLVSDEKLHLWHYWMNRWNFSNRGLFDLSDLTMLQNVTKCVLYD